MPEEPMELSEHDALTQEEEEIIRSFIEISSPAIHDTLIRMNHRLSMKNCRQVAEAIVQALKAHSEAEILAEKDN